MQDEQLDGLRSQVKGKRFNVFEYVVKNAQYACSIGLKVNEIDNRQNGFEASCPSPPFNEIDPEVHLGTYISCTLVSKVLSDQVVSFS